MSDSIKDCKDEKCQLESQLAEALANFCAKYGVILRGVNAVQQPTFQQGGQIWSGEIKLSVTL
jgi:hypothetical protein